jgi:hypothetical protein
MSGISKSQVSRLCQEIDERVKVFLERPLEGDCPPVTLARYPGRARSVHGLPRFARQ